MAQTKRQKQKQESRQRNHRRNLEWMFEYLSNHPCEQCGEDDPVVLEFHHKIPNDKKYNVSDLVKRGYSIESIKTEVKKCNVLCANCHRRLTAHENEYYNVMLDGT